MRCNLKGDSVVKRIDEYQGSLLSKTSLNLPLWLSVVSLLYCFILHSQLLSTRCQTIFSYNCQLNSHVDYYYFFIMTPLEFYYNTVILYHSSSSNGGLDCKQNGHILIAFLEWIQFDQRVDNSGNDVWLLN